VGAAAVAADTQAALAGDAAEGIHGVLRAFTPAASAAGPTSTKSLYITSRRSTP
jgi:hypothetical protein